MCSLVICFTVIFLSSDRSDRGDRCGLRWPVAVRKIPRENNFNMYSCYTVYMYEYEILIDS